MLVVRIRNLTTAMGMATPQANLVVNTVSLCPHAAGAIVEAATAADMVAATQDVGEDAGAGGAWCGMGAIGAHRVQLLRGVVQSIHAGGGAAFWSVAHRLHGQGGARAAGDCGGR